MRRMVFALGLCSGCLVAGRPMERDLRDDRVARQISQQERWAQQALDARPSPDQLERIRSGDPSAVAAGRKELQKLVQAVDRGTWVRDTAAELIREDGDAALAQDFDAGGRLRADAMQAADTLAGALADAPGGLTAADLRSALEALRKAQASEDALAKQPPKASGVKLAAAPIPAPRPFTEAAAKMASADPDAAKQLEAQLPPAEVTKMRAKAADLEREEEERKRSQPAEPQPPAPAAPGTPAPGGAMAETEAQAPSTTLTIGNDAASLMAKKPPKSITLREDGLFQLSYDDGEYLVDPDGKLVRKEAPAAAAPAAAPAPAPEKTPAPAPAKK